CARYGDDDSGYHYSFDYW
nr:immunoglobulin heavy chain junction region [Macaca mulatta]MOW20570.1 immunoglobulin heavy chain junction region [Macaca mulatta]MOW20767.1 immunoglobulin heavy chain junction region [Macaca mulatta]MOW21024.1 immunoglobulin heavy chain junction region [Macaca mulatta]MOW21606.1 immunoglobulin heavy chain junction region [Macaca mulatta]